MSLEDLKRLGVFVESDEATDAAGDRRVSRPLIMATAGLAAGACVVIVFGDGGFLTWLGVGLFVVGLFGFIAVNAFGVHDE